MTAGALASAAQESPATSSTQSTGTSLTLLHTNDIHDILKNAPKGGIAYIGGYVKSLKERQKNVLAIDAGDLLQKGDLFSVTGKGVPAYKALKMAGIDVTVPGNHDYAYGPGPLVETCKEIGLPVLCANLYDPRTRKLVFPPAMEREIQGVRIGLIGGTVLPSGSRKGGKIKDDRVVSNGREITDIPLLGKEVDRLAQEMEPRVDLTIFVYHNGTEGAVRVAEMAPLVDIVVCGHTNEITEKPIVAKTGALVVEAGRGAENVGHMELTVDPAANTIQDYTYKIVPMDPAKVQPDPAIVEQILAWEKEYLPEKGEALTVLSEPINGEARGEFLGQALCKGTGADLAMIGENTFRGSLSKGEITRDSLYKILHPRYDKPIVTFTVTGGQLARIAQFRKDKGGAAVIYGSEDGSSARVLPEELQMEKEYKIATYQSFLVEPNNRPYGIKPALEELRVETSVLPKTTLDLVAEYARSLDDAKKDDAQDSE